MQVRPCWLGTALCWPTAYSHLSSTEGLGVETVTQPRSPGLGPVPCLAFLPVSCTGQPGWFRCCANVAFCHLGLPWDQSEGEQNRDYKDELLCIGAQSIAGLKAGEQDPASLRGWIT